MITIKPVTGTIDAVVKVPGSKSYTNRALITAALANGTSTITNALFSDDTKYMASSLNVLGIPVEEHQNTSRYVVHGKSGSIPIAQGNLFVGNAGTAMRFLTAMLTLGNGVYEVDGVLRMRQRPIQDLLDGLRQLGADVVSKNNDGCPPVIIRAKGLQGGLAVVKGNLSSQYFSALLMTSPYAKKDVIIEVKGNLVSKRYVNMTVALMREFGVQVENHDYRMFIVKSGQRYQATNYEVEGDASAASYFFGAAAITGGKVRVVGIGSNSLQGDDVFKDKADTWFRSMVAAERTGPETLEGLDSLAARLSGHVESLGAGELHRSYTSGSGQADLRYANFLQGEVWLTREDPLVCAICAEKHFEITMEQPITDSHPRCRCWKVPILLDAEEPMTRFQPNPLNYVEFLQSIGRR